MKWIDFKIEKPLDRCRNNVPILAFGINSIWDATYNQRRDKTYSGEYNITPYITHWMYRPKNPDV